MTYEEYATIHLPKLFAITESVLPGYPMTCGNYYSVHSGKFQAQFKIIDQYITLDDSSKVLDLGTSIPFVSYLLYLKFNCTVISSDISDRKWVLNEKVYHRFCSLNHLQLEQEAFDLVLLTSVIPHLPGNLIQMLTTVVQSIKTGGQLFIEMPIIAGGGESKILFDNEFEVDLNQYHDGFFRYFTVSDTEALFARFPQLVTVQNWSVAGTVGYGPGFYDKLMKVER